MEDVALPCVHKALVLSAASGKTEMAGILPKHDLW